MSDYPIYFGGFASASAACFTHPLDLLKVRLQTAKTAGSTLSVITTIVAREGPLTFYNGLSASLLRQLTYSVARFGAFDVLSPLASAHVFENRPLPLHGKIGVSICAGLVGGAVGTPADVVNIRMQAGGSPFKHAFDGLFQIAKADGVLALWTGVGPNLVRAALMTAGQIATYEQVKQIAVESFDMPNNLKEEFWGTVGTQFMCSNVAGLVATAVCSPVDVVKTRIMSSPKGMYSSASQCLGAIVKHEGPTALLKGFVPSWTRLGPHTVLTFLFLEQFKGLYDRF